MEQHEQVEHGAHEPRGAARSRVMSAEDLIGGRVLAWVGGLAVVLGLAFMLAIGVSSGAVGEGARTLLAAGLSGGLLGLGLWLHGRGRRSDAALAAVAAGVAGSYATVTVAAQVYELISSGVGIALAIAVGALATTIAVRWRSRVVASLGILGALCAPLLAGGAIDGGSVATLFVALAAAAGVLLWQRWNWLALAAYAISAPQWAYYLFEGGASPAGAMLTLAAFGGLGALLAVGHDLRLRSDEIGLPAAFLLALNAVAVATAGWFALAAMGEPTLGKAWLVGLALVHGAVGLVGPRMAGISRDLGLLALALAVVVTDVAFALVADGPILALGWTVTAVAFAALLRRTRWDGGGEELAGVGLGGHLAIATIAALTVDDPLAVLAGDSESSIAGLAAVALVAAGCLVSARVAGARGHALRVALDSLGLGTLALLTAFALDGAALALAWTAEAGLLAAIASRRHDEVAAWGSLAFLALAVLHVLFLDAPIYETRKVAVALTMVAPVAAISLVAFACGRLLPAVLAGADPAPLRGLLDVAAVSAGAYAIALGLEGLPVVVALALAATGLAAVAGRWRDPVLAGGSVALLATGALHALVYEAPPQALVTGLSDPLAAVAAGAALVAAALAAGRWLRPLNPHARPMLVGAAGATALYVASGLVVTPFESGGAVESTLLSAHQQGQVALSVFWGLVGVAAVAVGLTRDIRPLRVAALGLLGVAAVKVFLFDLATLTSIYRAVSFIGLGLLLLLGAFVWQRLRPRPPRDLRETPAALR